MPHPVQGTGNAGWCWAQEQLCRVKAALISVGVSMGDKVTEIRISFSSIQQLSLLRCAGPVVEAAMVCGLIDSCHFSKLFTRAFHF